MFWSWKDTKLCLSWATLDTPPWNVSRFFELITKSQVLNFLFLISPLTFRSYRLRGRENIKDASVHLQRTGQLGVLLLCVFLQTVHRALPRKGGVGEMGSQAGLQQTCAGREPESRHHVWIRSPHFPGRTRWQVEYICLPENAGVWSVFSMAFALATWELPLKGDLKTLQGAIVIMARRGIFQSSITPKSCEKLPRSMH